MKSFKYSFNICKNPVDSSVAYPYEDKELTVKPVMRNDYAKTPHLYFRVTIPAHVYRIILNSDVEYFKNRISDEGTFNESKVKFRNYIESERLSGVVSQMETLCADALMEDRLQKSDSKKVIFVKFSKSVSKVRGSYNHAPMGKRIKSSFQFFTGFAFEVDYFGRKKTVYETFTKPVKESLMSSDKKPRFRYFDNDIENKFDIIEWTQERENFLISVEESMEKLSSKMEDFFGNMTPKKLDNLVVNYNKQKLLT